jgi:glucose-1-phosphate adenylyltransferase
MAVVLAGGKGTRLGPLTKHVCKPALPFAAAWRNIDFTLSNCVNSEIGRIGVATQHKPEALLAHLRNVWNAPNGAPGASIQAWPADLRAPVTGYAGTADAVYRNLDLIRRQECGLVLVLAGDHVYSMDYRPMLEQHRRCGADVTIACVGIEPDQASQFGILSVDDRRRVAAFVEKPLRIEDVPAGDRVLASMGIYVFNTAVLVRALQRDALLHDSGHDFGSDILPRLVHEARIHAYPFEGDAAPLGGYWRDVGTPAAYWQAHLELLEASPQQQLDDSRWPLHGARIRPEFTARYAAASGRAGPDRSLVADGCRIDGSVQRSVLFSNVRVERSASVDRSVILPGAVIGRNCRLSGVIVSDGCRIPDGMVVAAQDLQPIVITAEDLEENLALSCA